MLVICLDEKPISSIAKDISVTVVEGCLKLLGVKLCVVFRKEMDNFSIIKFFDLDLYVSRCRFAYEAVGSD